MGKLTVPSSLELAPDGATLWYKFGPGWWEIATAPNSKPKRVEARQAVAAVKPPGLNGTSRLTSVEQSPDGKWTAWIDAETPYGPAFLYCRCGESETAKTKPLARMPIVSFRWQAIPDRSG